MKHDFSAAPVMVGHKARFWIYWKDGIARITVTEDTPVELCWGGPTDEGSSYYSERYSIEDGILKRECCSWGSDCDGRHETHATEHWTPDMGFEPMLEWLSDGSCRELPEHRPTWGDGHRSQRDFYAEAAGY